MNTQLTSAIPVSVLCSTKREKRFSAQYHENGQLRVLVAIVRWDDRCGNGQNTFSITADLFGGPVQRGESYYIVGEKKLGLISCGCQHEEIQRHIPTLAQFLKWHLVSADGPLHYLANTEYHVSTGKLDAARSSAVWPDATAEDLTAPGLKDRLRDRLTALMAEFKTAVESFGFVY